MTPELQKQIRDIAGRLVRLHNKFNDKNLNGSQMNADQFLSITTSIATGYLATIMFHAKSIVDANYKASGIDGIADIDLIIKNVTELFVAKVKNMDLLIQQGVTDDTKTH